jgi:hypothetical protein
MGCKILLQLHAATSVGHIAQLAGLTAHYRSLTGPEPCVIG